MVQRAPSSGDDGLDVERLLQELAVGVGYAGQGADRGRQNLLERLVLVGLVEVLGQVSG